MSPNSASTTAPTKAPPKSPAAQAAKKKPAPPAPATSAVAAPPVAAQPWRVGPTPAWVVPIDDAGIVVPSPGAAAPSPGQPAPAARQELLVDVQHHHLGARPQVYVRLISRALDAQALGSVAQPQIHFNPAFQTLVLHGATIQRDGQRVDRLKDARFELIRREQRLEQQVIDGAQTLLVVLNDVRVGEAVELAYTIEGDNPIHEGRIAAWFSLASDAPVGLLHQRLTAPADRPLQVRPLGGGQAPERLSEGGAQVLRVVRRQVAGLRAEQGTPPWVSSYPWVQISEYASWAEVDAWASRLFAAGPPAPALTARIEAFRATGLSGEALVAEVLRFVQDEVRYFSVSLGESSHRPKPAEQTLEQRLGDCKDKVVLLNALLGGLGFDVRPALVSTSRRRGIADGLPSHDVFDHVVTRLKLGERVLFLDATITGQGGALATRGYLPYGRALVVGEGAELQAVVTPESREADLIFEQRWDLSRPGAPVALTAVIRTRGLMAEQWRAGVAAGGEQRATEGLAGAYARVWPGLRAVGAPTVRDDRAANMLELTQAFELPRLGDYDNATLMAEFGAIELLDVLVGPPEAARRTPFHLDVPRLVESRIDILAPKVWTLRAPAPSEVNDRHFRFSSRVEIQDRRMSLLRRVERLSDEVQPAQVESCRQAVLRARNLIGTRVRLPLLDVAAITPLLESTRSRVQAQRGWRDDALGRLLLDSEFDRVAAARVLEDLPSDSRLAAQVRVARAVAANLLGDFAAGLADADAALALEATSEPALDARGVALVGLGRLDEAKSTFERLLGTGQRLSATKWMGAIAFAQGRHAEAETLLREVVDGGGGEDREFGLLWLYLAAEAQGGRGKAAIAPHVEATDASKLTGALLRYLDGRLGLEALLGRAREPGDMERMNLAEVHFYVGQQHAVQGRREEARRALQRCLDTGAVPHREVTFARLALTRSP